MNGSLGFDHRNDAMPETNNETPGAKPMTRLASLIAACFVVAVIAYPVLNQAAQIVA